MVLHKDNNKIIIIIHHIHQKHSQQHLNVQNGLILSRSNSHSNQKHSQQHLNVQNGLILSRSNSHSNQKHSAHGGNIKPSQSTTSLDNDEPNTRTTSTTNTVMGGLNSMFISREYTLQAFRTMFGVMTKLLYLS
eukprot:508074_1